MNKSKSLLAIYLALGVTGSATAIECNQDSLFFKVNLLCYGTTLDDAFNEIGDDAEYDNPNGLDISVGVVTNLADS